MGGFSASGNEERRPTENARWRNGAEAAGDGVAEAKAAGAYAVGFTRREWNILCYSALYESPMLDMP
jgi:hypothetical protein